MKSKCGGESHGSQHTKFVFTEPVNRISNRAHNTSRQIFSTADVVNDFIPDRIEEQPVDRKVTAACIFLGATELHRVRSASVEVLAVAAEGRDFNLTG